MLEFGSPSFPISSPLQKLNIESIKEFEIELYAKRDDLIHEVISGNKFRKLKFNLEELRSGKFESILTFGGAHSNHIIATAFLAKINGYTSIGIIRGEKPNDLSNTLRDAQSFGMELHFITRDEYSKKDDHNYLEQLKHMFPKSLIIPEGGANEWGVKGCEEIVTECNDIINFDYITVDCGTGATLAGIVRTLLPHQKAIGVQVLKGKDFITPEVHRFNEVNYSNFVVWTDYHLGGYAKNNSELIEFMRWFYFETNIKLDPIYTGKQFYAVFDKIKQGYFPKKSTIILTHTGGLQGIEGFEKRFGVRFYP